MPATLCCIPPLGTNIEDEVEFDAMQMYKIVFKMIKYTNQGMMFFLLEC